MSPPLVSIVTPSLNQGRFLRQAIDSVLSQAYPRLEYLVVDGGSEDDSLEILRSYGGRLRWLSEKDDGQAAAINKGFALSRGAILGWLNADDAYLPGAIDAAAKRFEDQPQLGLVYGKGRILDENGAFEGGFEGIESVCLWRLLNFLDYVLQPSAFFRRTFFEEVGGLDETLRFGLDWDLWIRLAAVSEPLFVEEEWACSREYGETKTSMGGWRRLRELRRIALRHTGRSWTPGVRLYTLDTLSKQLKKRLPDLLERPIDRFVEAAMRRLWHRVPVHADGWHGPRSRLVVPQRWGSLRATFRVESLPSRGVLTVRFLAAGEMLQEVRRSELGDFDVSLELPTHDGPFVDVRIETDHSFREESTGRRLSLRCLDLQAGSANTVSDHASDVQEGVVAAGGARRTDDVERRVEDLAD